MSGVSLQHGQVVVGWGFFQTDVECGALMSVRLRTLHGTDVSAGDLLGAMFGK